MIARALARRSRHREAATHGTEPVGHVDEAVAGVDGALVESGTVVGDLERQLVIVHRRR